MELKFADKGKAKQSAWQRIASGWTKRQDGKEIAHGGISFTIGAGLQADGKTPRELSITLKTGDRLMAFPNQNVSKNGPSYRLSVNTEEKPAVAKK